MKPGRVCKMEKGLCLVEKDLVTGMLSGGCNSYLSSKFIIHRRPSGKGSWLIILGTGGENGWVPNTTLHVCCSKKDTGNDLEGVVCQQTASKS